MVTDDDSRRYHSERDVITPTVIRVDDDGVSAFAVCFLVVRLRVTETVRPTEFAVVGPCRADGMSSSSSSSTGNRRAPRPKTPRPKTPRPETPRPETPGPETPAAGRPNGTPTSDLAAVVPAVLLSAVTFSVLRYFVQPLFGPDEHYIDEEFHVPQARRYCRSEFRQVCSLLLTHYFLFGLSTRAIAVRYTVQAVEDDVFVSSFRRRTM